MSDKRVSYGVIAFKIDHPVDTPHHQIIIEGRKVSKAVVDAIRSNGGELTTIGEAMTKGMEVETGEAEALGKKSFGEAALDGEGEE